MVSLALTILPLLATAGAQPIALRAINQSVAVVGGGLPKEWRRSLVDTSGRKRFDLVLRPLIAVEGGTVSIEVVISTPGSDRNLLGERPGFDERCNCFPRKATVLDVEEFKDGVEKSRLGRVRKFAIPSSSNVLILEIDEVVLGHGVGMCSPCDRIERLGGRVRIEAK